MTQVCSLFIPSAPAPNAWLLLSLLIGPPHSNAGCSGSQRECGCQPACLEAQFYHLLAVPSWSVT